MHLEYSVADERQRFIHGLVPQTKSTFHHVHRRIQPSSGGMQSIHFSCNREGEFINLVHVVNDGFITKANQLCHFSFTEDLGQIPPVVVGRDSVDTQHPRFPSLHSCFKREKIPALS